MSEDADFPGDEPLFARNNERGPGFTIYTCPRCGGERRDGMKCLTCEQSSCPDKRYAFQRSGWDPNSCPRCGNLTFMSEDEHGTHELACARCSLPTYYFMNFIHSLHNEMRFREAMTGARVFHQPVPSAPERAWLKEMKIAWEGGE